MQMWIPIQPVHSNTTVSPPVLCLYHSLPVASIYTTKYGFCGQCPHVDSAGPPLLDSRYSCDGLRVFQLLLTHGGNCDEGAYAACAKRRRLKMCS